MSVKYFVRGVNVDTTCDLGLDIDMDLNTVQGSDTSPVSASINSNSYADKFSFDVDASGDSPATGDIDYSFKIDASLDIDMQVRVQDIDDTGCSAGSTTGPNTHATPIGTGVITGTLSSHVWDAASERLRIIVAFRREPLVPHGTKTLSIAVSHADSHITAQGFGGAGGVSIPIAAYHHYHHNQDG